MTCVTKFVKLEELDARPERPSGAGGIASTTVHMLKIQNDKNSQQRAACTHSTTRVNSRNSQPNLSRAGEESRIWEEDRASHRKA